MNNFIKLLIIFFAILPFGLHHFGFIQIPQLITIGFISVRTYGLIVAFAMLLVSFLTYRLISQKGLNNFDATNLIIVTIGAGIIGARIYYVVTNFSQFKDNIISALYLWQGGLGILGGILFGTVAMYAFLRFNSQNPWPIIAALAIFVPLGQAVGRLGNLINYELFGFNTNLPWAMYVPIASNPYFNLNNATLFHPLYAYEAILNLVLFTFLYIYYKKIGLSKNLIVVYILGYTLIRFMMDFGKPFEAVPTLAQSITIVVWVIFIGVVIKNKLSNKHD